MVSVIVIDAVMEDEDVSVPAFDHHYWHRAKSKHVITFGLPQLSRNRVNLWQDALGSATITLNQRSKIHF